MCAYLNVSRHSVCCLHGNLLETHIDTAMHESDSTGYFQGKVSSKQSSRTQQKTAAKPPGIMLVHCCCCYCCRGPPVISPPLFFFLDFISSSSFLLSLFPFSPLHPFFVRFHPLFISSFSILSPSPSLSLFLFSSSPTSSSSLLVLISLSPPLLPLSHCPLSYFLTPLFSSFPLLYSRQFIIAFLRLSPSRLSSTCLPLSPPLGKSTSIILHFHILK